MDRQFPLEGLLRARALAEERAAAELAHHNGARTEAARAAQSARAGLAGLAGTRECAAATATSQVDVALALRAAAAARVRELDAAVNVATAAVLDATVQWDHARQQSAAIERLRERHEDEVAAEDQRHEQRVLDEVALRDKDRGE
ncbi:flagellar FliJ family protein [Demequina sp.]|uniref:flagellar FliJ family protein n=1 Tax=Demequina sp. TaxID=2050685 RepID=UPI003A8C4CF3